MTSHTVLRVCVGASVSKSLCSARPAAAPQRSAQSAPSCSAAVSAALLCFASGTSALVAARSSLLTGL